MLKSKFIHRLLHGLIVLVGAGLGIAATLGALQIYRWLRPAEPLALIYLAAAYVLMAGLGALVFHLLSDRIIHAFAEVTAALERYLDKLSGAQLVSSSMGLLGGMMIAALLCQILRFMGESVFTTAASGILYVVLGLTGFSVGRRRSGDISLLMDKTFLRGSKRKSKAGEDAVHPRPKVLDTSVLIDGRILEICRLGFVEGELIIPGFVLEELRRLADSADATRRIRGRRGLDTAQKLQTDEHLSLRVDDTDYPELMETDMKLLRLAQEHEAAVVSGDVGLCKIARLSRMTALNLNELSTALRPVVSPGEEITVQLIKEGKEPGQGVGYMPDGTMIVVEGGRALMGKNISVIVTSALQTSAGRMIFARLPSASPDA